MTSDALWAWQPLNNAAGVILRLEMQVRASRVRASGGAGEGAESRVLFWVKSVSRRAQIFVAVSLRFQQHPSVMDERTQHSPGGADTYTFKETISRRFKNDPRDLVSPIKQGNRPSLLLLFRCCSSISKFMFLLPAPTFLSHAGEPASWSARGDYPSSGTGSLVSRRREQQCSLIPSYSLARAGARSK